MKYTVIIDEAAYHEILSAVAFVKRVSLEAANNLYRDILKAIKSLEEFPYRYPLDQKITILKETYRRMVINERYIAYYCVEGDKVIIEYFKDVRSK